MFRGKKKNLKKVPEPTTMPGRGKLESRLNEAEDTLKRPLSSIGQAAFKVQFQADLEDEFGTTEYGRRQQLFDKAWQTGSQEGARSVYQKYQEQVRFIYLGPEQDLG